MRVRRHDPIYLLADGTPATGWAPVSRPRRLAAGVLDAVLMVVTLGVGWLAWTVHLAGRATTPGKRLLGMTVFATDTRLPATRRRVLLRTLVYGSLSAALSISTLGLSWLYMVVGVAGHNRRPITDEWAQVIVMRPPVEATAG